MASTKKPSRTILYKNAKFLKVSEMPKIAGKTLSNQLKVETESRSYRFRELDWAVTEGLREDEKIVIFFYYPQKKIWKENFENFLEESNFENRGHELDFLVLVRFEAKDEVITKNDMDMILDKTVAKRTLHVTLNKENKDSLLRMILDRYEYMEDKMFANLIRSIPDQPIFQRTRDLLEAAWKSFRQAKTGEEYTESERQSMQSASRDDKFMFSESM